jgi:ankyrin repeat protein
VACGKYKKCPELVHLLLQYGANANSKTVTGTSVFSDAVTSRHLDLARCLLESGANPNATEVTGQPILITVICDKKIGQKDKVELVRLMLERGCNPNKARDFVFGEKAIDIARRAGNLEIVALLEKYS